MTSKGQLLQEPSSYTAIESLAPEWIKDWGRPTIHTDIVPTQAVFEYFAEVIRSFDRSFYRQGPIPILRLAYCSAADELADRVQPYGAWRSYTPAEVVDTVDVKAEEPQAPPSEMVNHLLDWLHVTYDELAEMTGVSRSALFYWRKTGASPRAGNVRQVLRLYSFVSLLVRRFGKEGARRWLHSDGQTAWDSLTRGDVEQAEDIARKQLFGLKSHPSRGSRTLSEEADFSGGIGASAPMKRATRRPKRGRPGAS
jgi:hypothetical protein